MSLPRERENQVMQLNVRDRVGLTRKIEHTLFVLPDYCNGCELRSDNCAAGQITQIQQESLDFGYDNQNLVGREINELRNKVDCIAWLIQQASQCGDRVEYGNHPIIVDVEERIEKNKAGMS